ncbi:hypothetical protein RD792_005378 [Penstemon davidsonii]|uniref:Uncharacterized protein n=1 Tax=Penstemon davidsonii TaxID=160366 RepID=A0ABR0DL81_9LAMI|nr:hypothetical protein RD792_005378 [Penstemon davidsonii]
MGHMGPNPGSGASQTRNRISVRFGPFAHPYNVQHLINCNWNWKWEKSACNAGNGKKACTGLISKHFSSVKYFPEDFIRSL